MYIQFQERFHAIDFGRVSNLPLVIVILYTIGNEIFYFLKNRNLVEA
jgi:hypothetical protein